MSNLGLGQTTWNRFFREAGLWLAPMKCLRNEARRFNTKRNRIQVFEINDVNGFTSLWTLAGVKIGTNTDEDGLLYVRITDENPGAGQALVELYKAAGGGGGNKVATGSAADNGTITLAAANSSGLTGTVKIGVVSASESNDKHMLQVFPDWGLRAPVVWDNTVSADPSSNSAFLAALPRAEARINDAVAAIEAGLTSWLQARWAQLMASGQTAPISHSAEAVDGVVDVAFAGLLEDGRINMRDETTPAAQTVVKIAVSAGAGVADTQNQGKFSMSAPGMYEWAPPGVLRFEVIDDTIGAEEFSVKLIDAVTGESTSSENSLTIKKAFSDALLGIRSATLARTLTLDAGSGADFATAADHTITGETALNTSDGILYLKVTAGVADPAKFIIELYSSSSYGSTTIVGKTGEGAANAVVSIAAQRQSGLGGTFKIGTAPTAGHATGTLNLNPARKKNTNGVTDKITVAVTVASRGEFQDHIAETFQYALNSAASGAETIDDSYVSAGTFPAFEVRDV